jgi:type VI secretion system secreted protein VgrG
MPTADTLVLTLESDDFPCDRLRVRAFSGKEAISQLFAYDVELVCVDHDGPSADAMNGAHVTLVIEREPGPRGGWHGVRRLHGVVAEVDDLLAAHADFRVYRLHVVPRAFALALVETQDIFMQHTVPDIVAGKLEAVGLDGAAVARRLEGAYAAREFIVQYQESDLAFVSRLTEHLGISFFFEHGDTADTIVFADAIEGFSRLEEHLAFRPRGEALDVFELASRRRMVPAYYAVRDYNYRAPLVDLTADHELAEGFAGGVIEYGAHHKTPEEGKAIAVVRAEERRATQLVHTGRSAVPALGAGMRFTLEGHPDLGEQALLVTEIEHRAIQVVAGYEATEEPGYANTFRAIPADRTYRPPRVTPRPRIAGLVTGIIEVPPGAVPEVSAVRHAKLDEQGRYLVRFLFDTTPPGERPASRPVRMIQNHAGEGYGTHFPLKPGIEVVIAFIDGDPDRPLIVGAVPNPIKPSPVTVANPGIHRIKTSTGIVVDMAE